MATTEDGWKNPDIRQLPITPILRIPHKSPQKRNLVDFIGLLP
jgi:hypothetical protein